MTPSREAPTGLPPAVTAADPATAAAHPAGSLPHLVVVAKCQFSLPFREDTLNYASYRAIARQCRRIDLIVTSARPTGHEETEGVMRVHAAPAGRGLLGHLRYLRFAIRTVKQLEAAAPPDVYWLSDPLDSGLVGRVASRGGAPVVLHVQGDLLRVSKSRFGWVQRLAMRWLLRTAVCRATVVRVVAGSLRKDMEGLGADPARVVVIPTRVDLEVFASEPHRAEGLRRRGELGWDDAQVLVTVGSHNDSKGLDMLLAAAAQVRAEAPRLRYLLVGDGPLRAELEEQARQLGLTDIVHFAGRAKHQDVPTWLAAADILAQPSRDEGLPRSALEGAAMGLALLLTRVGGNAEAVIEGETGWLVEPTTESIADGLRDVHRTGREGTEAMGRRGRKQVAGNYEFQSNLDSIVYHLLDRVVADHPRVGRHKRGGR